MNEDRDGDTVDMGARDRLLGRLDRMVEVGRVTAEEARHLRAASSPAEFDAAAGAIRARHAGAKLDAAVARGVLGRSEADDILRRLRHGQHSPSFQQQVRAATRQTRLESGALGTDHCEARDATP